MHRDGRWRFRLEETYSLTSRLRECRTADEICRYLLRFLRRYGATNVLAGMIPPPHSSRRTQRSHIVLDGWPKAWSHRYFSSGYLERDPTIRLVRRGCEKFSWRDVGELSPVCPNGRRIMSEAREYGLIEGITYSFPTVESATFGFSIAAKHLELGESDRVTLQFVAAYGLGCALTLASRPVDDDGLHLTRRQREAVGWASEGCTLHEIAERLDVSVHTAEMHLRGARARLGVANTAQAVAEALRRGLIG